MWGFAMSEEMNPLKWGRWWNLHSLIHHDNVPAHTSLPVQHYYATRNVAMVHTSWFGLLCDIFLFPIMKLQLWGCHFQTSLTFKDNHWSSYTWFQKVNSSGASSRGRTPVPTAWTWKGSTMKVTPTSNKGQFNYWLSQFNYWLSLRISGYAIIHNNMTPKFNIN
jgi:hypothetical protein